MKDVVCVVAARGIWAFDPGVKWTRFLQQFPWRNSIPRHFQANVDDKDSSTSVPLPLKLSVLGVGRKKAFL